MTRLSLILYLSLFLFQFCCCSAFSPNNVLVAVGQGTRNYIIELDISGHQVQFNQLGGACAGCHLNVDSTGNVALLPLYSGSNPYDVYGFTYDVQVSAGLTTLTSQSSTSSAMVMDGQDMWFNVGGDVVYTVRGSSGSGVTIYSASTNITYMQLVGTRLYALIDTSLKVMDPIVKSATGNFSTTLLVDVVSFHVSDSSLYTTSFDQYLRKYTLGSDGTIAETKYNINLLSESLAPVYSMTSVQHSDVINLILIGRDSQYSFFSRVNDTGSEFNSLTTILAIDSSYMYSVGPTPKLTCSDTVKNQDESDVDCGGSICSGCAIGKTCSVDGDCLSNKCTNQVCVVSCSDGVKNQDETDIDCGGSTCTNKCSVGQQCNNDADCASNMCSNSVCEAPPVAPVTIPIASPVAPPVTSPVTTPINTPTAEQTPDQAPQTSSSVAPSSSSPVTSTPSNSSPSSPDTSTPARSLISRAGSVVTTSVIGVISLVLLI